jgi:hypothetical protein
VKYRPKPGLSDPAIILARRRSEILTEYRVNRLDPIRIAGEPISMELALLLGLLIDTTIPVEQQAEISPSQRERA